MLMVLAGAVVLLPGQASAAGAANTITTNNVYGNLQNSFTVDGALFFGVYLNQSTSQVVTISLINTTSGATLRAMTVTTASTGVYQSWVSSNFNFFDLTNFNTGNYKLQLSVTGIAVANASFTISYPVYKAHVETTLSDYSTANHYFTVGSEIYANIVATDQFGNPMSGNTSAGLYELVYSGMANTSQHVYISGYTPPNDYGISSVAFYSGFVGYRSGEYNLTIEFAGYPAGSNNYDPVIGHAVYYLINPSVTISPYRPGNIYGQGTTLQFEGVFSPFDGAINVSIASSSTGAQIFNESNVALSGGYWNGSYKVNYSVPDGAYIFTVTEASNNYTVYTTYLYFQALILSAFANEAYYLPGEPATIYYTVTNTSNNAPAVGANVSYIMNYTTTSGAQSLQGVVSGGVLNLVIPYTTKIPSTVHVTLRAVDSYGHNATQELYLGVHKLIGFVSTDSPSYYPSQPVTVSVQAAVGPNAFNYAPVAGAKVYVNVSIGGSVISSYSGSGLTTDAQGIASYAFMLSRNATLGTYTVNAKITAYGWSNTTTYTFQVTKQPVVYTLELVPGQTSYVGGQEFTATWMLVNNGTAKTPAFASFVAYIGNSVVAAGTNSNGTISFQVPTNTNGILYMAVSASDAEGDSASSALSVSVSQALLVINPSTLEFSPSTVVTFSYHVIGSGFSSPVYLYTIEDNNGNSVASGTLTASSISFSIPKNPSLSYTLYLTATNKTSGGVVNQSSTIYELSGTVMSFSISQSSYVSGTYSPGQSVSLYYSITAYGSGSLSSAYTIYVWIPGMPVSYRMYSVTSSSGTLSYTIPNGVSQGNYQIESYAVSVPSNGNTPVVAQSLQISSVEPFWNYNVVGGVSLGSVIMGILTLVALALAVIAYSGKRVHTRPPPKSGQPQQQGKQAEAKPEQGKDEGDSKPPA